MAGAEPLYERFGGMEAVARLVFAFYDRILRSRQLKRHFDGVDMRRLIDHQTKFLASVMGGPPSHTNAELRKAHAHLRIDDEAFDEMIDILDETLRTFGLAEGDMSLILSDVRSRRAQIVSPPKIDAKL
jgi:hemoglobin